MLYISFSTALIKHLDADWLTLIYVNIKLLFNISYRSWNTFKGYYCLNVTDAMIRRCCNSYVSVQQVTRRNHYWANIFHTGNGFPRQGHVRSCSVGFSFLSRNRIGKVNTPRSCASPQFFKMSHNFSFLVNYVRVKQVGH